MDDVAYALGLQQVIFHRLKINIAPGELLGMTFRQSGNLVLTPLLNCGLPCPVTLSVATGLLVPVLHFIKVCGCLDMHQCGLQSETGSGFMITSAE